MNVPALRPSPAQDVLQLTNSLAKAGWGSDFAAPAFRASRIVLRELANAMYAARRGRAAAIDITAPQLADRTGYTERWTRDALATLEALGLIQWHRGGIVEGAPRPSLIRIVKAALADLIYTARVWHDDVIDARVIATKARLKATLRWRFCKGRKRRANPHAEVSSLLSLYEGRKGAPLGAARPVLTSLNQSVSPRKEENTDMPKYRPAYMTYLAAECKHGEQVSDRCNRCRYEAIMRQQQAAEAERAAAERRRKDDETAENQDPESSWPPAFVEYMHSTYPDAKYFQWARLTLKDSTAKELLNAHAAA